MHWYHVAKRAKWNSLLIDERKYQKLLGAAQPVVIQTELEYRQLLHIVGQLMAKPEKEITVEEGRLLELLSFLIEEYEDRMHPLPKTRPHKMLAHLWPLLFGLTERSPTARISWKAHRQAMPRGRSSSRRKAPRPRRHSDWRSGPSSMPDR